MAFVLELQDLEAEPSEELYPTYSTFTWGC
jgi:hypothetical protein